MKIFVKCAKAQEKKKCLLHAMYTSEIVAVAVRKLEAVKLVTEQGRQMMINKIIHKLTLLDASAYRCIGRCETGKYKHEPKGFRRNLEKIYQSLSEEELIYLYNTRKGWI